MYQFFWECWIMLLVINHILAEVEYISYFGHHTCDFRFFPLQLLYSRTGVSDYDEGYLSLVCIGLK